MSERGTFSPDLVADDLEFIGRLVRFSGGDAWRLAELIAAHTAVTLTRTQLEIILDRAEAAR